MLPFLASNLSLTWLNAWLPPAALTESYGDLQSSWSQSMARDAAEWPAKSALVPSLEQQQLFLPMMPMMSTPHAALVAQINALDLSLRQQVAQLVDTLQPGVVHKNESEWTFTVSQLTDSTVAYVMQALANAKGALAEPRWALPSELLEADVALRKRQSESGEMMLTPAAKRIKTEELSDEYSTEDSSEYTASPDELASPTSPMDESSADATSAHSCAVCKKSFPTATSLNKHLKTHSDERQFACTHPGCQKRFSHSSTLKDHMNIHLQRKPYTCKECGKGFPNGSNLNRHARIHTKSKPYVCNVCNKAFSQSSNLRVHQKIHDRPPKHE